MDCPVSWRLCRFVSVHSLSGTSVHQMIVVSVCRMLTDPMQWCDACTDASGLLCSCSIPVILLDSMHVTLPSDQQMQAEDCCHMMCYHHVHMMVST